MGINHFDRAGTCGTTAAPKAVNWELTVPNGEYTVLVDFGEDHYTQGCETEGRLCHGTRFNGIVRGSMFSD